MKSANEIEAALQLVVDAGEIAGAATLIWRDGVTQTACAGWRDIEAGLPVERDTIFRIASMTKPITSVGADRPGCSLCPRVRAHARAAVAERSPGRNRSGGTPDYL